MKRRILLLAGSTGLAVALIALLFRSMRVGLDDLFVTLGTMPGWLLAAVCLLTFANLMAAVARWYTAAAWLSPTAPKIGYLAMLEATAWGAFLGQLIPPQFSMSISRWAAARNGAAVGVTLYEGLFDFVILGSGAVAALAALGFQTTNGASMLLFGLAILLGCISIRWMMAAGCKLAALLAATHLPGARLAAVLAVPLDRASQAPAGTLAALLAWSFFRMVLLSLRTVLIACILLPGIEWGTVAIGYPIVGLAISVPFLPAGLGLVEWTWTGLLVSAGALAPAAAIAAVSIRLVNLAALAIVVLALLPFRMGRSPAMQVKEAPHG
jgi:hypothetical protein